MFIEYQASISHESLRIPDVYPFYYSGNKLISPVTGLPIESSMIVTTKVDEQEMDAFQHIQTWVGNNSTGVAFWLSPPHYLRSSQAKIIVSELETIDGIKWLYNRAVLFDTSKFASIQIANQLAETFSEQELFFDSEESIRSTPIFTSEYLQTEVWSQVISQVISENYQWDMISTGKDIEEMENTLSIIKSGGVAPIGSNPLSCPFNKMLSSAESVRILCCTCPLCNKKVEAVISGGKIKCPSCKAERPWVG